MKIPVRLAIAIPAVAALLAATETKIWSQSDHSDFEKATLKGVSLASDGRLTLAPQFREVFDSASVYLWAMAEDSKGNLYTGGGGPGGPSARVYMIAPDGKGKTLAQFDDLEVHAIAVDRKDQVFVATSPDGKIYRVAPNGKTEVFYDPKAKYIWGMAFDSKGDLLVATGDHGDVHRVSPDGHGKVFYSSSETHARSIAIDAKDNVIIGTEPGGLIIRIAPDGGSFVLYQAPKREITAVAVAKDGAIYAAGVGNKPPSGGQLPTGAPPSIPMQPSAPAAMPGAQVQQRPVQAVPVPVLPTIAGGSDVYRINPDGFPHRAWTHAQHIVYSIAFDGEGRPLIATGNKGMLYRLDSGSVYTELLNAPPAQIMCIYAGKGGKIYAATGNVGKVYQVGPGFEKEGTIVSEPFDAGLFSRWGRLSFRGKSNGGRISIQTRSGNLDRPEKDWSAWSAAITAADGGRVASPAARFLQCQAKLETTTSTSPELQWIDVAYQGHNVAPEVQEIEITPVNYRFPQSSSTLTMTTPPSISLPAMGRPSRSVTSSSLESGAATLNYAKGYIGARWMATDENGDGLVYTVQIRGENEHEWKLLKDKVNEKRLSWDSTAFPDGEYRLRVLASDAPSNPIDQALSGDMESEMFLIDNTPPAISALAAAPASGKLKVSFKAADALSVIEKAEISVDGGEWMFVEPVTRLSDSREQEYAVLLPLPAGNEHTVAVRVADEYDNQAVAKVVVQ